MTMLKRTSPNKECQDFERRWFDFCVDKNLQDDWLRRLNHLKAFSLIGICEGHHQRRARSASRYPHIHLRLMEHLLPGIARDWEELRAALLNEVHRLFQVGDTYFFLELKFKLRAGRGKLVYQEDLVLKMRCFTARVSDEMPAAVNDWFDQTVARIEDLDEIVLNWHERKPSNHQSLAN